MSNLLKAFINIPNNYQAVVNTATSGSNRANSMGEGLKEYVKRSDTIKMFYREIK